MISDSNFLYFREVQRSQDKVLDLNCKYIYIYIYLRIQHNCQRANLHIYQSKQSTVNTSLLCYSYSLVHFLTWCFEYKLSECWGLAQLSRLPWSATLLPASSSFSKHTSLFFLSFSELNFSEFFLGSTLLYQSIAK